MSYSCYRAHNRTAGRIIRSRRVCSMLAAYTLNNRIAMIETCCLKTIVAADSV